MPTVSAMSASEFLKPGAAIIDDSGSRNVPVAPRTGRQRLGDFLRVIGSRDIVRPGILPGNSGWRIVSVLQRCLTVLKISFLHPYDFLRLVDVLTAAKFSGLTRRNPALFTKFLGKMLARSFSVADRAVSMTNHYRYLHEHFSRELVDEVVEDRAVLWEGVEEGAKLAIGLTAESRVHGEGELSLYYAVDLVDVFTLSFTFVPGRLLGLGVDQAILISRLQGTKDQAERIKAATKAVGDISPTLLLMAAVQGMALALDIEAVVGICAADHPGMEDNPRANDFMSAYDQFWTSIEGRPLASGNFYFEVPLREKALQLIKQNHRPRVRARRKFRATVSNHVRTKIAELRMA
jgi:uncharacterized protein VirK/YbjX